MKKKILGTKGKFLEPKTKFYLHWALNKKGNDQTKGFGNSSVTFK